MRRFRLAGVAVCMLAVAAGCSGNESSSSSTTTGGSTVTSKSGGTAGSTTTVARPEGPAADLSEEITGGGTPPADASGQDLTVVGYIPGTPFMGEATSPDLTGAGYVQQEFVASGTAESYQAVGELAGDGQWTFEPEASADYRTRVLVRRPEKAEDFSGTVIVEWLNVSGGVDASPDFTSLEEEIVRQGHIWVGVSAQLIGVAGGPVLVAPTGFEQYVGKGLMAIAPERYGTLDHPGDGFAFDIFTQVARAVRAGGPALGDLTPDVVLAAGESQSAFALTTYYNGVQPLTLAFDGFFVHSRGFAGLPLVEPGGYADLAGAMVNSKPTTFRTDLAAPVLMLQAESDVVGILNSIAVRQPDSDTFRLWEVAGTAHADVHLLGPIADTMDCGAPINDAPMHLVAKAALRGLDTWVVTGEAPVEAPLLEATEADEPAFVRDSDGIVEGGIRTPPIDVPVDVLSGVPGSNPDLICILMGSTLPLPDARIAELHPSRADYEQQFAAAIDETIEAGFLLEEDREAMAAYADPSRVAG